jgi:hypothetical protein
MTDRLADVWRERMCRADFEAAWRISDEALRKRAHCARAYNYEDSTWRGEPVAGKRILVCCCYGLGDTLQFIRYVPLLRRVARSVIVQTQAAIVKLLERVQGIDALITRYNHVASHMYDLAIGVSELPHLFRTNSETIPAEVPYIQIDPRLFPPTRNLKVGLVWHGSDWDERRAVPVQLFAGFERIADITLHVLQRGSALLRRPTRFGIDSGSDDIYEAARTIAGLDLMITIDSMPAHLAAAMGVPTWILLHSDCDWRWMRKRSDSPWYPTVRLFRQKQPGDWRPVIARVKQELEHAANSGFRTQSAAA